MQVVSGLEQVPVVMLRAEGVTTPRVEAGDGQARSENWSQCHCIVVGDVYCNLLQMHSLLNYY